MSEPKFSPFLLKNILHLLLVSDDFRDRFYHSLKPSYFDIGDPYLSTIVEAIFALEKQYNCFPSSDVLIEETFQNKGKNIDLFDEEPSEDEIEGLKAFLLDIYDMVDVNKKYIEDNLSKILSFLAIQKVVKDNKEEIQNGTLDVTDFASKIAAATIVASPLLLGKNLLEDLEERTEERLQNLIIPGSLTFPIPALASFLEGGKIPPGSLCYFLGATGSGKSQSLIYLAKEAAALDKYNVLYITAELTETLVKQRLDACITGIPINDIRGKARKVKDIYQKSSTYSAISSRIHVVEVPMGTTTVPEINAIIERLEKVKDFKTEVLIVDYADVLAPSKAQKEMRHARTAVYAELNELGRNKGIVVWSASQFNDQGAIEAEKEKGNISTRHTNEARGPSHIASFIVALARTKEEQEDGAARLVIVKNRIGGGVGFTVKIYPDFSRARLYTGKCDTLSPTDVAKPIDGLVTYDPADNPLDENGNRTFKTYNIYKNKEEEF